MTANRFGGRWTSDKLVVLRDYLAFYTQALKGQRFQRVYIDAFAGTGKCQVSDGSAEGRKIDGSATIALANEPAFEHYWFIEPKRKHREELEQLVHGHPLVARCTVMRSDAATSLPFVLQKYDWSKTRGVLFLDPYGLQCEWRLLQQIAATKALDVFFLLSLSGVYRQAAVQARAIDAGKAARLTALFGTEDWRTAIYTREQGGLFDGPEISRAPGWRDLLDFATARLRLIFPTVVEPALLGQASGAPLFALYFCACNPSPAAQALAGRVGREVLNKLR